ncbi:hypothetical protein OAK87_01430 [bacterium]|nr:hypothetical protein [bacterium]
MAAPPRAISHALVMAKQSFDVKVLPMRRYLDSWIKSSERHSWLSNRDPLTNSGTDTSYWIARYKESNWCFEGRNSKPPWIITILLVVLFLWWRAEGAAFVAPWAVIGLWRMYFEKNALADCAHALSELKGREYDRDELSKPLTLEEKAMLKRTKELFS